MFNNDNIISKCSVIRISKILIKKTFYLYDM